MKERKKDLRKLIAKEKMQYAPAALKEFSAKILTHLETHPTFTKATTLFIYHSMEDEVSTHSFIEKWSLQKKIILPVVIGDTLELRRYTGPKDLVIGAYGIAEPIGVAFTHYDDIDLAVIPGVAFDADGGRLGRGKGYYDQLLPQIKAFKVGICFPFQLIEKVPIEPFDIGMDAVITL